MILRILNTLSRNLTVSDGHFHPGPRGPYPCHDPSCRGAR